ncbi:alpha/beta fold hydrolase [Kocuria carniphila]|uniref:Alpha/beta fold hydrolase n=1 Tax=Kocuria carniphila TaxID=262208 RepID=A0ABV3V5K4_9MICC
MSISTPLSTVRQVPLAVPRSDSPATPRLCVFSHAGGSVADFRSWTREMVGMDVDVIDLPGRSSRLHEDPIDDMDTLAAAVAQNVSIGSNVMFLGHSFGATLALATCFQARELGLSMPATLAVSAARPPHLEHGLTALLDSSDTELLRGLNEQFDTVPAAILADPDVASVLARAVRADLTALAHFVPRSKDPLDLRLVILEPDDDNVTGEMAEWSQYATSVEHHVVPGGHFYIRNTDAVGYVFDLLRSHI